MSRSRFSLTTAHSRGLYHFTHFDRLSGALPGDKLTGLGVQVKMHPGSEFVEPLHQLRGRDIHDRSSSRVPFRRISLFLYLSLSRTHVSHISRALRPCRFMFRSPRRRVTHERLSLPLALSLPLSSLFHTCGTQIEARAAVKPEQQERQRRRRIRETATAIAEDDGNDGKTSAPRRGLDRL